MSAPRPTATTTRLRGAGVAGVLAAAAVLGAATMATAQSDEDGDQRIEFAPGTDNASVQGAAAAGVNDRYVLGAAAGQIMTVTVESAGGAAIARVFTPDDRVAQPSDSGTLAVLLPLDGDYVVEVSSIRGVAPYTVTFRITDPAPQPSGVTERIEFAPGTNNSSVNGAIVLGTTDRYLLRAGAGQTMVVHVDSVERNAVFDVHAPDGTVLVTEQQQATFMLPADGDYVVEVVSTRGNATYQLSVWIE